MRSICFALLTPFFFLRAGTLISTSALVSGAGVIVLLLAVNSPPSGVAISTRSRPCSSTKTSSGAASWWISTVPAGTVIRFM
jgi:hypothetical protein